jgi:16S rRNA A1518/A1519 N6-dimethyltransferase RsmA/KsgA/DIM1 with predicted DNA glycosylase/AP lyase activity
MRTRIRYSQNFLKDPTLVSKLVSMSSLSPEDTVYEIGAGQGIITRELLKNSKRVVAFEVDKNLCQKLKIIFKSVGNKLEIIQADYLKSTIPSYKYKVFSNVPFNKLLTSLKNLFLLIIPQMIFILLCKRKQQPSLWANLSLVKIASCLY